MSLERIVVKVGTNVLTAEGGKINHDLLAGLVGQIAALKNTGREVVLVSSGAVGAGRAHLELPGKLNAVTQRQVFSAVGQVKLMSFYQEAFRTHQLFCAQVLATKEDFRDRDHFINMKRCILALLRDNIVPVVNENDVISISELMFTDNDELAGLMAALINAEKLIILSNVAGLQTSSGVLLQTVAADDTSVHRHITSARSSFGRGGMLTKVQICQQAAKLGIHAYIANGKSCNLTEIVEGSSSAHTHFLPKKKRSGLKKWIAHQDGMTSARIFINQGAYHRLTDSAAIASLLPVGITAVDGEFKKGDLIQICGENQEPVGIGIAAYSATKLRQVVGKQGQKAFIHYNYLLIH